MSREVANIILSQLGGHKFVVMTGAKNLTSHDDERGALSFRISSTMTKNKCNHVKITLNGSDLYDVTFSKIDPRDLKQISKFSDVYAEDLENLFQDETGLATRLF